METKKPVPLWKGIVGTAVSAFILFVVFIVFLLLYVSEKGGPMWLMIFLFVAAVVSLISLILGIVNISDANAYRRQNQTVKVINSSSQVENSKKIELLHKLLAEGKITIEEYDELKK